MLIQMCASSKKSHDSSRPCMDSAEHFREIKYIFQSIRS